jgi:predicted negative regulator of RcsB-dependent stress response
VFVFDVWACAVIAVTVFGFGAAFGWRLRAKMRDTSMELRAQAADMDQLRAALTDNQKRSAQQAEWLAAFEEAATAPARLSAAGARD